MRKSLFFSIIILLLLGSLWCADYTDFYSSASTWFTDDNTGRTVFPLLKIPLGVRTGRHGRSFNGWFLWILGPYWAIRQPTSLLPISELLFSHNNSISDSSIESAAYTKRYGNWGIGLAGQLVHLPFTEYDSWAEPISAALIPEGVVTLNASYNFLSSYYFRGISLEPTLRGLPGRFRLDYPDQTLFSGMLDLGAITQFNFLKFYDSRDRNFLSD